MKRKLKSASVLAGVLLLGLLVNSARDVMRPGYGVSDWLAWWACAGEHPEPGTRRASRKVALRRCSRA